MHRKTRDILLFTAVVLASGSVTFALHELRAQTVPSMWFEPGGTAMEAEEESFEEPYLVGETGMTGEETGTAMQSEGSAGEGGDPEIATPPGGEAASEPIAGDDAATPAPTPGPTPIPGPTPGNTPPGVPPNPPGPPTPIPGPGTPPVPPAECLPPSGDDDGDGTPNSQDPDCSVSQIQPCTPGGDDDNDGTPNDMDDDCIGGIAEGTESSTGNDDSSHAAAGEIDSEFFAGEEVYEDEPFSSLAASENPQAEQFLRVMEEPIQDFIDNLREIFQALTRS